MVGRERLTAKKIPDAETKGRSVEGAVDVAVSPAGLVVGDARAGSARFVASASARPVGASAQGLGQRCADKRPSAVCRAVAPVAARLVCLAPPVGGQGAVVAV